MLRSLVVACLVLIGGIWWMVNLPEPIAAEPAAPQLRTQVRRPVALATLERLLVVANRESGSLTLLDRSTGTIIAEHNLAERIADMRQMPDQSALLVVDDQQNQLLKVTIKDQQVTAKCLALTPFPASKLGWDASTRTAFVSAKWAHRVMAFTLDATGDRVRQTRIIKLPFAPLDVLPLSASRIVLVADAFGNRLAVVDSQNGKVLRRREIEGHNIRGLAESQDGCRVLIAHQHMPKHALADYEELHWGRMVTNAVQVFDPQELLRGGSETVAKGWMDEHGGIGRAAGDPSEVLTGPGGLVAVAFGGVNEIAVQRPGYKKRFPVGAYPEAMAIAENQLYVANRFGDSISVIDLKQGKNLRTISLGPSPRLTSEQRGEMLFFDARLSHDGWMSCQSCHSDGHTSGLIVDTLGDGDYGAPKLVPSLLGTRDTQPWGWNGSVALFREQIQKSITTTMHGEPLAAREMEDLAAYLSSLNAPPPPGPHDPQLVETGKAVFHARGCVACHAPPAYTTPVTVEVSLLDELQRHTFNPPSLRGVSQRQRYFHDGRAATLEAVLFKVKHQLEAPLKKEEAEALLAFLRSL